VALVNETDRGRNFCGRLPRLQKAPCFCHPQLDHEGVRSHARHGTKTAHEVVRAQTSCFREICDTEPGVSDSGVGKFDRAADGRRLNLRKPRRAAPICVAHEDRRHSRGKCLLSSQRLVHGLFNYAVKSGQPQRQPTILMQRHSGEMRRAAMSVAEQVRGQRSQRARIRIERPVRPTAVSFSGLARVHLARRDDEHVPRARNPATPPDTVALCAPSECSDHHLLVEVRPIAVLKALTNQQLDATFTQGGVMP
jgi:hypothetical protein